MTDTAYCYHCRIHHPKTEMRQVGQKGLKRWRCLKSIEATRKSREEREAFGRSVTEMNKSEAAAKARIVNASRQEK